MRGEGAAARPLVMERTVCADVSCLAVKSKGRIEAPDLRRLRALYSSDRGVKRVTHQRPFERLLADTSQVSSLTRKSHHKFARLDAASPHCEFGGFRRDSDLKYRVNVH